MDNELEKEGHYEKYLSTKRGLNYTYSKYVQHTLSFKSTRRTDSKMIRVLMETGFFYKKD